jgi:energy-coupling factor transporter ATP-binding protein EcfA2
VDQPSKPTHDSTRGPLHTSGSIPSRTTSSVRSDIARSPLHTSGSAPARPDSSSGMRVDPRRTSLGSSPSVSARSARPDSSPTEEAVFWRGPRFAPESVAETGIRLNFLEDLALKLLNLSGPMSLRDLSTQIRLSFSVVNELLRRMRSEQFCEITGMSGNIPQIAITSRGRTRAAELSLISHYAGPAPVSLENYTRQVRDQSVREVPIHSPEIERGFAHLVLDNSILEKLGTALNSGTSIFLYGPSGTGKTTIATALAKVLSVDRIWIPYAVEVDGQIINVYDPHVHDKVDDLVTSQGGDARWVLCNRPTVSVGGELTLEMLELQFSPITKFHTAPVQMKANNGVMIIDDFGRQRFRPEELLNRWVVPLDRRVDYLTLSGGRKIEVPFEPCVVFATNLNPSTLTDEAFMRRIQTKIKIGTVTDEQFHAIFRVVCKESELLCEAALVDELINVIRKRLNEPLRGCHPRDLVNQICWKARYKDTEARFDREALIDAVDAYFVRKDEN